MFAQPVIGVVEKLGDRRVQLRGITKRDRIRNLLSLALIMGINEFRGGGEIILSFRSLNVYLFVANSPRESL